MTRRESDRPLRWTIWAAAVLALALQVVAIGSQSLVGDATYHLLAGHQALRYGTNTLNLEHPPLVKLVAALPLLGLDHLEPVEPPLEPADALRASGAVYRQPEVLRRGRLAGRGLVLLLFGIPWLVCCVSLGRAVAGERCGRLLALAVALSFGVLPYVAILQTDVPLALAVSLALLGAVRYARRPSFGAAAWMGAGLGLGLAVKFSAPLMAPALAVALLLGARIRLGAGLDRQGGMKRGWRALGADLALVAVLSLAVPAGTYALANRSYDPAAGRQSIVQYVEGRGTLIVGDELRPWRDTLLAVERVSPGAAQWLTGFLGIAAQNRLGVYPSFAFGRIDSGGRWWYFPAVFLVKTPLVLLLMLLAAALAAVRARAWRRSPDAEADRTGRVDRAVVLVLGTAVAVYLGTALTSSYNIGVRHLLPITPLLYLPAASWAARTRLRSAVLVGALALEAVLLAPLWMSATNTWWLGSANPTRFSLGASDLEYRQNFLLLADELARRNVQRVGVLYPALPPDVVPAYLPDGFNARPGRPIRPGWYAVNVRLEQYIPALLRATPADLRNYDSFLGVARAWEPYWQELLRRAEDHGYVAGTFHLYRVPEGEGAAERAAPRSGPKPGAKENAGPARRSAAKRRQLDPAPADDRAGGAALELPAVERGVPGLAAHPRPVDGDLGVQVEQRHVRRAALGQAASGQAHHPGRLGRQQGDHPGERQHAAVDQPVEAEGHGRLEPQDAVGREGELHVLLVRVVGRVVAGDAVDGAVHQAGEQRLPVRLGPQRRLHLEVGREARVGDRLVGQEEVVGRRLAGRRQAALLGPRAPARRRRRWRGAGRGSGRRSRPAGSGRGR